MQGKHRLLLHNIKQLVQVSDKKEPFKRMQNCTDLAIKTGFSVAVDCFGKILKIGQAEQISKEFSENEF